MELKTAGVVGAGLMGSGIAQTMAQSGFQTIISEINQQLLDKGLGMIKNNLSNAVAKGKIQQADMDAVLGRIKGTTNVKDFKDCDLIVEAAVENMDLKKKIFAELDQICPPHTIIGTNSSSLSIIDLAVATKRPEKILGLHFFNPVPVMKLLEIVKTIVTSEETLQTCKEFGAKMGKTVITAKDAPAYIVNRLLIPYLMAAIRLYEVGYASKEDIDAGMRLGCNYPMGPLELLDFVGCDTAMYAAQAMFDELHEPQMAPPLLLKKMVAAGQLGRKTGKGFYDYRK
ncbi:MAG TPA: 3-hydroxybutyryl-CoA dehydrogenase [Dehalococcoidia bacterium]|nr:3-hydroxybutyryl-CoA dehydrogenase [Dehalococcoidia bacterium]